MLFPDGSIGELFEHWATKFEARVRIPIVLATVRYFSKMMPHLSYVPTVRGVTPDESKQDVHPPPFPVNAIVQFYR